MRAVPPVERMPKPSRLRPRPSSSTPVLSETLMSACFDAVMGRMRRMPGAARSGVSLDAVCLDLLAQGVAIHAEDLGGLGLVAAHAMQHHFDQGPFHRADDHVVHGGGLLAVQVA